MSSGMPLKKIAFMLFGKLLEPNAAYFDSMKIGLRRAGIRTQVLEYVSAVALYSLIGFAVSLVVLSVALSYIIPTLAVTVSAFESVYAYTLAIILSFFVAGAILFAGYYYPSMMSQNMKSRIERSLPFTVFYMSTSASSGIQPVEIFNMLSRRKGLIAKEAGKICNDVNALGMSLTDALQKAAARTPSPLLADLFWNMSSIITTGGDLDKYLSEKTKTFMSQYRRNLDYYAKQISLYTEVYVTLVIVGSLFFIVLLSIMSPMVGGSSISLMLQTFLAFFIIPAVSIGFIVLLKAIYPSE